ATWQYPIERMCGMLLPLEHSRQHPYTNLRNQITTWIHFSHLQYKVEIKQKLFDSG
ncbi:23064_t:CDS:1, partial [Gigaspora rosea]